MVDSGGFGQGCSHANCGYVSPSHVLPLTEPGAVSKGLAGLLKADAPLRIKPRWDPRLWGWLFRFARRCNKRDMLAAARGLHVLLKSSAELFAELIPAEPLDCEWQQRGLLFVFQSEQGMEKYAAKDRLMAEEFGLGAKRFDGPELTALEPALKPGIAGGWLYECDSHLRPDRLMSSWRKRLEARGVEIREHCRVTGLDGDGPKALGVRTPEGTLSAEAVVLATGALTPEFQRELGCRIPIQPGKGYSMTMPRPAQCPEIPMIFCEHKVAVTPMESGYRLGSTMEFAGYDTSLNPTRLGALRRGAEQYLHEPFCEPVEEQWFGWRPMTYDGLPIVGPAPRYKNVWIAAGHNMLGLSMATGTGRLISELVTEQTPHLDPAPYAVTRFG